MNAETTNRRVAVIVNAGAGTAQGFSGEGLRAQLAALFAEAGLDAAIELCEGDAIGDAAQRAVNAARAGEFGAVVAGGGDGTIRCVAELVADTGIAFGVLPLGTLNHFARDLGLPLELDAAVRAIAEGEVRTVDAAEVNGRVFLNNASVGLYPFLVQDRERRQNAHGLTKWIAAGLASLRMLWRFPVRRLALTVEGETRPHRTPILFVGNNEYRMELPGFGERARLDGGELWICVTRSQSRLGLVALALRTIFGFADTARDLEVLRTTTAEIRGRSTRLPVAFDGEADVLRPPLHFRTRPGALRVLVPKSRVV